MKILFYLHRYPEFGGIEKVTEILTQYLEEKGHQISILSYIQNPTAFHYNSRISYYQMPNPDFKSNKNYLFMNRFLKEQQFDIIILQDSYAPIENVLFANITNINSKIIIAEHNTPNSGWDIFKYIHTHTKLSFKNKLLTPYHYWNMYFRTKNRYKKLYRKADKYVLLSNKFIPIFKKRSGITNLHKCYSINNPITIPIPPQRTILKQKEILFVGRFTPQKGIDMLMDIWKELSFKYPEWTLKLVGGGELESYIIEYIKNNQIQNIKLEGFQKDTSLYYQNASILCLTSIFEGWGLVLTEAMSRGCIPIAFQSFESITDIIDNNLNGFLVPPFDIEIFITKIKQIIDNPKLRIEISHNAISKSKKFTIENIGNKWEQLFKEITQ